MKEKVQVFGRFLSSMVMPNIGAFIAWGLIAALFIDTGWIPNAYLSKLVDPMSHYMLPLLIAYTGGKLVGGVRGGVTGAIATMGVIVATEVPMFLGAMIMGPFSGWIIKNFDKAIKGKVKAGFEMLVDNFSVGIIGGALAIFCVFVFAPAMTAATGAMAAGVQFFVDHHILFLASVFIEPAKVLFLNNAINHGILTPLGLEQVAQQGKSVFFLMEANPGPGLGILLAYCVAGKGTAKETAPGAIIIHFFGGIHEIFFPYVLMNPILLLATIGGGMTGIATLTLFGAGLVGPASPGSIIAILAMVPKSGGYLGVLAGVAAATAVSFLIAVPLLKIFGKDEDLEDAIAKKDAMKAESKGAAVPVAAIENPSDIRKIVFACDAGMGSSAMGATVLQKKLTKAGRGDIKVDHASVSDIPSDAQIVVTHQDLRERAAHSAPQAELVLITNFMNAPQYDELAVRLSDTAPKAVTGGQAPASSQASSAKNEGILPLKNIQVNCKPMAKDDAIRKAGQILVDSGCVDPAYIPAMLEREKTFATNIGNGIAIPHGVEEAKANVKRSGISVQVFPEGTLWDDGRKVRLVIGIAGVGDDHLDILANIATKLATEEAVDALMTMSPEGIQHFFTTSD